jgi:hypothetical protein
MLRRLLAASPVVVLALACASPTLPLPPPLWPSISPAPPLATGMPDNDHVTLTAACNVPERNAVIVVINEGAGVPADRAVGGALTNACGGWDSVVYAHSGDPLVITYQVGGQISQPTVITVP